jgi:hypothetical protein
MAAYLILAVSAYAQSIFYMFFWDTEDRSGSPVVYVNWSKYLPYGHYPLTYNRLYNLSSKYENIDNCGKPVTPSVNAATQIFSDLHTGS